MIVNEGMFFNQKRGTEPVPPFEPRVTKDLVPFDQ